MLNTQTNLAWDTLLPIDEAALANALHVRLTSALRDAIRLGKIPVGSALPPSRQLASDLRCSRWVVTEAYEQLVAEGYLEARWAQGQGCACATTSSLSPSLLPGVAAEPALRPDPGLPDFTAFPRSRGRARSDTITTMRRSDLDYQEEATQAEAGAHRVPRTRASAVVQDDITITSGILDGLSLLLRALVAADRTRVAIEDPCWRRLVAAVQRPGLDVIPIEVDAEGMQSGDLSEVAVQAAIVAPAHQFPTGMVLTPERRMLLLEWARASDARARG